MLQLLDRAAAGPSESRIRDVPAVLFWGISGARLARTAARGLRHLLTSSTLFNGHSFLLSSFSKEGDAVSVLYPTRLHVNYRYRQILRIAGIL